MLKYCCALVLFLFTMMSLPAQNMARENNAFQEGEELVYTVSYNSAMGELTAGTAKIKVEGSTYNNMEVLHIVGIGETNNLFDMLYKVRDQFESWIDPATLLPYQFVRQTREGKFAFDDEIVFKRETGVAQSSRTSKPVTPEVHDIVSGVFFMRTLDVLDFGKDSLYYIDFYLDDSLYHSVIRFDGRGVVETKFGYLPCLKISPMVITGEIFSRKYPMSVWVTDDENHIPVLAESEIVVGSVRMELNHYDKLKHPFIQPLSMEEVRKIRRTK